MSCDFAVWYPDRRLTDAEADERYGRLCESQVGELVDHPSVQAFYDEVTSLHPEIDDVPEERVGDFEFSPWSCAMDRSDGHVIMCCVWSRADYVTDLVRRLARKHGLALYDPQSARVFHPDGKEVTRKKPWWRP
jgi:hypothetical protein